MARKFFVGGNWKMQASKKKVTELIDMLNTECKAVDASKIDIVVCPSFVFLESAIKEIKKPVKVCAQNCYKVESGAFTGEISVSMLRDIGCEWVLLGHSERRHIFHENDELISQKAKFAVDNGLQVIYCIGEQLSERESGKTEEVIKCQMQALLSLSPDMSKIVLAYEPVWAIGTGKTATSEQAQEVHSFVRKMLEEVSLEVSEQTRIIYGGSVTAGNCVELGKQPDVDGFLVGGASLKLDFIKIVNSNV